MRSKWIVVGCLAMGLGVGCSHMGKQKEEDEEKGEVKMMLGDVPGPVRDTLTREAGGATIKTVDKEQTKSGQTVYETDVMSGGKNWEIRVAPDGTLISKKVDNEEAEKSDKKSEKEEDEKDEHK